MKRILGVFSHPLNGRLTRLWDTLASLVFFFAVGLLLTWVLIYLFFAPTTRIDRKDKDNGR